MAIFLRVFKKRHEFVLSQTPFGQKKVPLQGIVVQKLLSWGMIQSAQYLLSNTRKVNVAPIVAHFSSLGVMPWC